MKGSRARVALCVGVFPVLFDHLDRFVFLVQLGDVAFPAFQHFELIVHIVRVDIVIERKGVRDLHLKSLVCNYPVVDIKRTFLSFCDDWVLNFDIFLFA